MMKNMNSFRYRAVRPLCLPDPNNQIEDSWVTVVGWGRKEYFGMCIKSQLYFLYLNGIMN
jgi:hypothetical protein